FVRSLLEPLLPHYLVTRYKKASMLSEVKFSEWVFYGLARIVAILTSVLQYGLLGFPLPSKVLRRKV
ncbi:MAG: hypothetical protein QXI32_04150, partial [Candidatus Bathyarchaeia archaeon]